jgi:hypothetical protein
MIKNTKFEILTPSGFRDFAGIQKIEKKFSIIIKTTNGKKIQCSDKHRFLTQSKLISAKDLKVGDKLDSLHDEIYIIDTQISEKPIELYDIVEVENGNLFCINDGIVCHNCDFLSSGDTFVNAEILGRYYLPMCVDPVEHLGIDRKVFIYKQPVTGGKYIISADTSRGDAESESAFSVINMDDLSIDADYAGMMPPQDFGKLLVQMGYLYNAALLIPENNYLGYTALQSIIDEKYPHLYYTKKGQEKSFIIDSKLVTHPYDTEKIAGFITSPKNRMLMLDNMCMMIEQKLVKIPSKRLINQLLNFRVVMGKPKADSGKRDDLVMAYSIGLYCLDTTFRWNTFNNDYTKAMITSMTKIETKIPDFLPERINQQIFFTDPRKITDKVTREMYDALLEN